MAGDQQFGGQQNGWKDSKTNNKSQRRIQKKKEKKFVEEPPLPPLVTLRAGDGAIMAHCWGNRAKFVHLPVQRLHFSNYAASQINLKALKKTPRHFPPPFVVQKISAPFSPESMFSPSSSPSISNNPGPPNGLIHLRRHVCFIVCFTHHPFQFRMICFNFYKEIKVFFEQ